jgi:MOSC domain-containing protein YiiM
MEDARWWERELGRDLHPGAFGENLTTEGLDVTGAVIGERWRIGSTDSSRLAPHPVQDLRGVLGRSRPRQELHAHGAPGAYLRVTREGDIGAGGPHRSRPSPAHGVTIGEVFRARSGERALVPRMLEADELPKEAKDWARKVLGVVAR